MPAVSRAQQKFFGIVRAIQKGEMAPTTPETAKAAASMKKKDVKDFASTKHKKLPEKVVAKEDSNPRIPRKKGNLQTLRSILIFTLMRIPRELFMVWDSRMLLLLRHLFQRFVIHQDLMLTKSRQQLLWNREQEKWVRLQRQQSIESI